MLDITFSEIVVTICCIILIIGMIFALKRKVEYQEYVHNIETKLNIYEESYDNYCLEDALKQ